MSMIRGGTRPRGRLSLVKHTHTHTKKKKFVFLALHLFLWPSSALPFWPLVSSALFLQLLCLDLPEVEPPAIRMDSRPPNQLLLLLLTSLLHFWQCARGQSSYTIDGVVLTILPNRTVPSGTPVTLRCQVTVSHDSSLHLTNIFQFVQDDVPIHRHVTTKDTVLYELNPARAADSGNYECGVIVKEKSKISSSQKLTVTGLQTPTLHLSKENPFEGEEFMATCSAPEEKGTLTFRFHQKFRDGLSLQIKKATPTQNSSETQLGLKKVGDSHLYCDYEITLSYGTRRSEPSNEVQVIVKALYIAPVMNVLPSNTVYEGDIIEVVCKVITPLSNIEVFLTKDRKVLKQARVGLNHQLKAQEGGSGELICKAEWGNLQQETTLNITVKELFSKPLLTVEPKDIYEEDMFRLTCSVSIYVPEKIQNGTIRFSIYKDTTKLSSVESYTAVANVKRNGNYSCKAQATSLGQTFLKGSQTVVIKAKVPVSKPRLSVVGERLVLGKRFQLLCLSNSGTLPINYTLFGPGSMPEVRMVSKPGEQAVFNISAIYTRSDLNKFLCHAKNNPKRPPMVGSGEQLLRSTATQIIEPVSKPVLTMQPDYGDISEGQNVILVCTVQRGTPPITFTWYHMEKRRALAFQNSEKLRGTHSINNIKREDKGSYYCESTNQANDAKRSLTVVIGVKMAGWKKGLIAVFCVLLLLALILVIIFKRHLLHFKRKRTVELSVKSAGTKAERLSLTQAEVNEAANVTPGMIGKSVWSEHVSGSESDDLNSVTSPETPEPRYTEVPARQAEPNRAPAAKGPDVVYNEIRISKQGVPEKNDGQGSVEYAQLNHDTDHSSDLSDQGHHGNNGNHAVQDDHIDEIDTGAVADADATDAAADHAE